MTAYIVKVEGLCYDLSWAWKSGKKPSPTKEQIKKILPIENSESGWSEDPDYCFLKKLNRIIPQVATRPINILLCVSLSFESLTLEKNTPTIITESKLQDLAITTAGKEA